MNRASFFKIAYKLAVEALFFGLIAGFGFMLSEMVLPGFLSARIHYFSVYAGVVLLISLIIGLGSKVISEKVATLEQPSPCIFPIVSGIGITVFLTIASKNLSGFPLLIIMSVTAVAVALLLAEMPERTESLK